MSRSHRRFSRPMIVLLIALMAVSAIFVLHKLNRSTASTAQPQANLPSSVPLAQPPAPLPLAPSPIETRTPTTNPSQFQVTPASQTIQPDQGAVSQTQMPPATNQWANLLDHGSAGAAPPLTLGRGPLLDGQTLLNAGRLLDARKTLNDALQAGKLTPADTQSAMQMIARINQTVIFSPQHFADDPFGGVYTVRPGDRLARIAMQYSTTWQLLALINNITPRTLRAGATIKVVRGPFFAVVHKKTYTMDLYMGALPGSADSMYVKSVEVGLGRDDSTPTGVWSVGPNAKLLHPTYYPPEGGPPIEADDPKNPLGGYWMALTGISGDAVGKTSYGVHGTNDQNSIGQQDSLGCIRVGANDIPLVFDLMVEGKSQVMVVE